MAAIDPARFSDDYMIETGSKAAVQGWSKAVAEGNYIYTSSYDGIKFRVFLDRNTLEITNFHPRL